VDRNKTSIVQALQWATRTIQQNGIGNPRLDAEVLLTYCTNRTREDLYANSSHFLADKDWEKYIRCIERRAQREPVAYITGQKEFRRLTFGITRDVLIPRPETETLFEDLLDKCTLLNRDKAHLNILELGTGSGIIAISLAQEITNATIVATDITFEIISLARENARIHGFEDAINFFVGDCAHALKSGNSEHCFDCIVFNPPYLSDTEWQLVQPEILNYEPCHALCGGSDGLDFYRNLIPAVDSLLCAGGYLLLEIGAGQAVSVTDMIQQTRAYSDISVLQDLAGLDRVVSARKEATI
jgi:release factor glutamine methyltransferase